MNGEQILQHAANTLAERHAAYGEAANSMRAIAARWSLTLSHAVTPTQVVLCMIDLKLDRLTHDPKYQDGPADVIGYAALLPEVNQ